MLSIQNSHSKTHANNYRLYPLWGVFFIALGGSIAIAIIPELDYYRPGALRWPAIALSLGLIAGPIVAALSKPHSLIRTESILCLGLFYWILLDAIQGVHGLWGTSLEAVKTAFLGVTVFGISLWAGSVTLTIFLNQQKAVSWTTNISANFIFYTAIFCFFAGMLKPILACNFSPQCIIDSFFVPWYNVPWRTVKFGSFDTILKYIGFLGYLTLPLTAALSHIGKNSTWRVALLLALSSILLLIFMQSGARRVVGMVVIATGLIWTLLHYRPGIRQIVGLGLISLLTLYVLESMLEWRTQGIGYAFTSESENHTDQNSGLVSVDKNLYYMTHAMTVVPERYNYQPIDGALSALGAPIPRSIWPSKPAQGGIPLLALIGERKAPGFSWSCSAVCDFYLMGGITAVAMGGFIFGCLAHLSNRILYQAKSVPSRLTYAFSIMILFIGIRAIRDLTAIGLILIIVWGIFYLKKSHFIKNEHRPTRQRRMQ